MNTRRYLQGLSLDQLRYARDTAAEMIAAKEKEDRVPLLVVQGTTVNEAYFYESDFYEAKEKLCRIIMSDQFSLSDVKSDHPRIVRQHVLPCDVHDYMALNT